LTLRERWSGKRARATARIYDTARRHRVKCQPCASARHSKIAIDIDDDIGSVRDEDVYASGRAGDDNSRIRFHQHIERV
jgi:hypothetical protein